MKNNEITIRRAAVKDIPAIHRLLTQVNKIHHDGRPDIFNLGNKYTDEELEALLQDEKRPIFVAVDAQDEVQGYCFCVMEQHPNDNILTDIKTVYIDDLCVDENARGMHVGTKLYEYVLAFAKEMGCYNVTLNVWALNESALKFYQACGMKPLKTYMETIL